MASFGDVATVHCHRSIQVEGRASHRNPGSESLSDTISLVDPNILLQRTIWSSSGNRAQMARNLAAFGWFAEPLRDRKWSLKNTRRAKVCPMWNSGNAREGVRVS